MTGPTYGQWRLGARVFSRPKRKAHWKGLLLLMLMQKCHGLRGALNIALVSRQGVAVVSMSRRVDLSLGWGRFDYAVPLQLFLHEMDWSWDNETSILPVRNIKIVNFTYESRSIIVVGKLRF